MLNRRTRFGFSTRQGLHQLAQKSIIVTLPNLSFKLNLLPSGLGPSKKGAICPTSAFGLCFKISPTALPEGVFFIRSLKPSNNSFASGICIALFAIKRSKIKIDMNELGDDLRKFNRLWKNLYDYNSSDFIINYQSRELRLKKFSNGICRMSFRELCEKPLSTLDYLNLCNYVKVLFLENIPQINNSQNDFARRFINLIDILYEAKIQLICFSSVSIEEIYKGKKLDKEFMITISRLNEMISTDWVN